MGKNFMQYHHIGTDFGETATLLCSHCKRQVLIEVRTLPDGTGDSIVMAFTGQQQDLEKEFKLED